MQIIPCEISTKGNMLELEDIIQLDEDTHLMNLLEDEKGRVLGPAELTYPRWNEWEVKVEGKNKKASTIKIKDIYRTLRAKDERKSNCINK